MSTPNNDNSVMKTGFHEPMKSYSVYDGSNRLEYLYEAPTTATNGAPCLITRYTYVTGTTRVEKMKEYSGVWSSAYDI